MRKITSIQINNFYYDNLLTYIDNNWQLTDVSISVEPLQRSVLAEMASGIAVLVGDVTIVPAETIIWHKCRLI